MSCLYAEYNNIEHMSNDKYNIIENMGNEEDKLINPLSGISSLIAPEQSNPPHPPKVNPDEYNKLKDIYNNQVIFKEKYNKLPKVMFFLSSNLFNIPDGYNPYIYLQGFYRELEKEVGNKIVLTGFLEEQIKNIQHKHNRVLIPAGIDKDMYLMMLRSELTDIISNILKNIPHQSQAPQGTIEAAENTRLKAMIMAKDIQYKDKYMFPGAPLIYNTAINAEKQVEEKQKLHLIYGSIITFIILFIVIFIFVYNYKKIFNKKF